ncbi:vacuolar protein sorting-associated protein 16 homolog isoform X2 [Daphnia carinata]|uniref:vacuolar protein sorting-associated protein 16 homolog isoform X2 n=1 Tax=Daphnia carinata TaxID=120202 RepID=UPI002580F444|nr:vacuolar protein sorting-associated protein 16 homolog isoform X2 [Daphnia carinata]
MSIGVPIKVLHEAEGHIITCETNTGEIYRGKLVEAEDNMNCQMTNITVTYRDGRVAQLENVYIRRVQKLQVLDLPQEEENQPFLEHKLHVEEEELEEEVQEAGHLEINLQDLKVTVAPSGGPIAVVRDDTKLTPVQTSGKPIIFIFSPSGELKSTIKWSGGKIVEINWSSSEELLCIQDDGSVSAYDIFGNYQNSFQMGQEAREMKIIDARTFPSSTGTGLVVLTTNFRFFVVNNIKDPRIRRFPDIPGVNIAPSCWTAIHGDDRQTRVIVAKEKDIYLLDYSEQHVAQKIPEISHHHLSIIAMAVSPCSKLVALLTDAGVIWIGAFDFRRKFCEHDAQCMLPAVQLVWCGSGAVVLNLGSVLLVLSPNRDNFTLILDSTSHVCPEVDGLRIITNSSHEFLQKVPLPNQEIFRIGSMSPGAILVEASREFQKRSHRAEEYIRLVKNQLELAVTQCIQAAGNEWQPTVQKVLLRAAQLGKSFLFDKVDSELFVGICQTLRILNAVRNYKIALPLTFQQYEQLGKTGLLNRLILRRQYTVAIQICQFLQMSEADGIPRVLTEWACYKIKHGLGKLDAEQLASEISAKLGTGSKVSYSSIALKAIECKQEKLAIRLLDFEHRASEQIPLLLKLGQEPQALAKAVESGDPNLIYYVLVVMKETYSADKFYMTIRHYPSVNALYAKLCRTIQMGSLEQIYEQEDNFNAQAILSVKDSYRAQKLENRSAMLTTAVKQYRQAKAEIAASLTEDQLKLLKTQSGYESKFGCPAIDVSLNDTLKLLMRRRDIKETEEMVKKFKVPERRLWWLKVTTFAEIGDWAELEKLSRLKKSPIGYEPFVDVCLQYNNITEAQRYLPKVEEHLSIKYYVKAKLYTEAAQIAFQRRDTEALHYVQSRCSSNRDVVDMINSLIAKLANPSESQNKR